MRKTLLMAALLLVSTVLSFSATSAQAPVVVTMNAENGSGQTGAATLTAMGLQTLVQINIAPGPGGVAQPVHIHSGRCPNVAAIVHVLSDVVNGRSTTLVNASLQELANGNLAINAHKSALEIAISTSCGDIPLQ